jgi:hypothetical protein
MVPNNGPKGDLVHLSGGGGVDNGIKMTPPLTRSGKSSYFF